MVDGAFPLDQYGQISLPKRERKIIMRKIRVMKKKKKNNLNNNQNTN